MKILNWRNGGPSLERGSAAPTKGWYGLYVQSNVGGSGHDDWAVVQIVLEGSEAPALNEVVRFCKSSDNRRQGAFSFHSAEYFAAGTKLFPNEKEENTSEQSDLEMKQVAAAALQAFIHDRQYEDVIWTEAGISPGTGDNWCLVLYLADESQMDKVPKEYGQCRVIAQADTRLEHSVPTARATRALLKAFSKIIFHHGPDSPQAEQFLSEHRHNREFVEQGQLGQALRRALLRKP